MVRSLRTVLISSALAAGSLAGVAPLAAQSSNRVDVQLVLAVDVSLSMSPSELEIQRAGYAAALRDKSVIDAIAGGANGRIAITYFEWAGTTSHHVIVPWTVIESAAEADRVAEQLGAAPPNSARRTSISAALEFAVDLFAESPFSSAKRVIDVSGDGPNNQGAPVAEIRDGVVEKGIAINGLPLMTNGGYVSDFDMKNLDIYYKNCVVGGPASFTIPVNDWKQFPEAIRRKLVLEIAAAPLPVIKAQFLPQAVQGAGYDCTIGEKMWRDRQKYWEMR